MTRDEIHSLLNRYHEETMFHSLSGPMMRTEAFSQIMLLGAEAIPSILEQLRDEEVRGMAFVLLLEILAKESHIESDAVTSEIVAVDVEKTVQNWLEWGVKHGHIKTATREANNEA